MRSLACGLLLLITTPALADDCAPRDFRAQLGPPRNQEGTRWCYAHSAADLISITLGKRVSSIDLATTYLLADDKILKEIRHPSMLRFLRENPDFFKRLRDSRIEEEAYRPEQILTSKGMLDSGGNDEEAIILSNIKGLCLEKRLPAEGHNVTSYLKTIHYELADQLRFHRDSTIRAYPIGEVEDEIAQIMARSFEDWVDRKCGKRFSPKRPLIPRQVSVAESVDELERLYGKSGVQRELAHQQLLREINRVLDQGQVPAIAYNAYDLLRSEPLPSSATNQPADTPHADHSSIIAARKRINGQCRYFVRNHFGANCGYRAELEAGCEKEAGGVWVPATALKNLYSVISIQEVR